MLDNGLHISSNIAEIMQAFISRSRFIPITEKLRPANIRVNKKIMKKYITHGKLIGLSSCNREKKYVSSLSLAKIKRFNVRVNWI